jgi:PHD/YefM family antitoxin component YafN of YafNO toxin-antitoxin module
MKFLSVREIRNQPGAVWKRLKDEDLVLTANGKPRGLLIGLDEEDLEVTLETLRRARAEVAVSRMRRQAAEAGLDRLGDAEIEAEIRAARAERRGRGAPRGGP